MGERVIGFWTCVALVVGNTIGMGIFLLPASLAPYGFNAMLAWGITAAGCVVLANVFARLARALPDADGPYGYIRLSLGDAPAFLALWSYWIATWVTTAALASGVVAYAVAVVPALAGVPAWLQATFLLWGFVAINLLGLRNGGRVQVVTTVLKLLPMLAIVLLGGWIALASPGAYVQQLPTRALGFGDTLAASTIALFAMLGFESATLPAARVERPAWTIPRATVIGTVLTAGICLVVSAVPLLLIPSDRLALADAPFAVVMDRYAVAGSGRWLAAFVVISGLGALNGWTLLLGEMTRTMAVNGVLPDILARGNRHDAPFVALIVTGLFASAMIAMGDSPSLVDTFTFLTRLVTAANLPLYLFVALALGARVRRDGLSWTCALLAATGVGYVAFAFVGLGRETSMLALALTVAGLPVYGAMRLWRRHRSAPPPMAVS